MKKYWLMKSEPGAYSIDDLKSDKQASWDGVRNYQARNYMKEMKMGDMCLFHHSNANPPAIVGIMKVCREAYPDHTALDKKDSHYDKKASKEKPIWEMVDVCFVRKFNEPISLAEVKANNKLSGMMLAQKGSRLSIQPVAEEHFKIIESKK